MKSSLSVSIVLIMGLLFLSCSAAEARRRSADAPRAERKPRITAAELEQKVHARINGEREQQGLAPLAWDDALGRVARAHSQDMAKRAYFSHVSPDSMDFSGRYDRAGYRCAVPQGRMIFTGAENIAQNNLFDSLTTLNGKSYYDWNSADEIAEQVVSGWMQSPGHRKNILTPHWGKEGVGVAITRDGKVFVTQNFC